MSFEAFGLSSSLLSAVQKLGYTEPTPIQSKAIPAIMEGRDVMGLAQTGTGKTAAFVLPVLHRLLESPKPAGNGRKLPRVLVIAPTRELSEQINDSVRDLGVRTPFKCMSIYGGASYFNQIQKLRKGVDIIVACPGRLLDHIEQGNIDLSALEVLVLDEADRMMDMGFMPDIKRILTYVPAQRQTLLFSATMPDDIRKLSKQIMPDPFTVQVNHSRPANTITHALCPVSEHLKMPFIKQLLKDIDSESVLIFTRTKAKTSRLTDMLQKEGFKATQLQGDMPQGKRQDSLNGFKNGRYQILVATDIAARGVDVLTISHVINFDMPDTADAYTHRVGRTGRASRSGKAMTLVTPDDAQAIRSFERFLAVEFTNHELEGFDYGVPTQRRAAPPAPRGGNRRAPRYTPRPRSTSATV